MNRKVPLWFVLLLLWCAFVAALLYGWEVWRIKTAKRGFNGKKEHFIIALASFPSLLKESVKEIKQPSMLIAPNLFPGVKGLKTENNYIDSNYVLLATYDKKAGQSVAKLIRLSDQKVIHQWTPHYNEFALKYSFKEKGWIKPDAKNQRLYHPLLLPDGSIVFNYMMSTLVKIDKNSKLVWASKEIYHHSTEQDADGNFWTPSVIVPSTYLAGILDDFKDSALTEVSPEGKVIFRRSVAQLLIKNGYRALLMGVGIYESDPLHLNDIQPALTSGRYWKKGDLLVSLRNRSTIFLYRPSTDKVIWLKTGPWLNQHDANFVDDERISVFGNNMVRAHGNEWLIDGHNEEYIYNFTTDSTITPYTAFLTGAKVATANEGQATILPNGDLFVEETNENRLLRGNTKSVEWQYVDRIDDQTVAALSRSRFITKAEFKKIKF